MKNQQSNADIANSLVFAIKYDLVAYKTVRNWADDLIANSDAAAPWMLDLSFCTANDVAFHLRNVPGAICKPTIHDMLFGLAYDAYETGAIDRFGLRDVGWAMYLDDPDTIPDHWGLRSISQLKLKSTDMLQSSMWIQYSLKLWINSDRSSRMCHCHCDVTRELKPETQFSTDLLIWVIAKNRLNEELVRNF